MKGGWESEADGDLLGELSPELVTAELCELAIDNASDAGDLARNIPQDLLTEELCLRLIEEDPYGLSSLPEDQRTESVCLAAVQANKWLLPQVPEQIRSEVASQAGIDPGQLERDRVENEKLMSGPTWRLFLRPMTEKVRHRGVLGWLEARPGWMLFFRLALSIVLLIVHVMLTVHIWQGEGWIAGGVTGACFVLAEMYWPGSGPATEQSWFRRCFSASVPPISSCSCSSSPNWWPPGRIRG